MTTRLYSTLAPTAPLFEFDVAGGSLLTDSDIQSVSINRGKSSPGGGVDPSTCEVEISGFGSVRTGNTCEFRLSTYGAARLNALCGANAALIRPRFNGRIGTQSVNDTGLSQQTTYGAASMSAQLVRNQRVYTAAQGTNTGVVIGALMTPPGLAISAPIRSAAADLYGTVWTPQTGTYSDLIGKYTSDLGILVRDTRLGGSQIHTHRSRMDRAISTIASATPLTRSHAISPATWEQANELVPRNYRVSYTGSGNTVVSAVYGEPDNTAVEVSEVDMKHAKFTNTSQPAMEGFARRSRDWVSSYSIPSITIDLLALITSPFAGHRSQAAWLLAMEVGDAVYLSGDWYSQLRGIQFAESIKETITPDSWTLELGLIPSHAAVGEVSPVIPSRVWNSATYGWNTDTRKWVES